MFYFYSARQRKMNVLLMLKLVLLLFVWKSNLNTWMIALGWAPAKPILLLLLVLVAFIFNKRFMRWMCDEVQMMLLLSMWPAHTNRMPFKCDQSHWKSARQPFMKPKGKILSDLKLLFGFFEFVFISSAHLNRKAKCLRATAYGYPHRIANYFFRMAPHGGRCFMVVHGPIPNSNDDGFNRPW